MESLHLSRLLLRKTACRLLSLIQELSNFASRAIVLGRM
nr:MAG TPA: hypothetical protein [Crassvirales sp.]